MRILFALATIAIFLGTGNVNGQQGRSNEKTVDQSQVNAQIKGPLTSQWSPGATPYGGANMPINIFPAVTGRPFHAEVNARKVETKADGKQITYESHGILARDSAGRVLQEGLPSPKVAVFGGTTFTTLSAKVTDPTTKLEFRWDEMTKTVLKMRPLSHQIRAIAEPLDACEREQDRARSYPNGATQRSESLGERTIQGILTRGCRVYTFITAQPNVNGPPRTIIDDSWSSTDLGMSLLRVHHDPSGEDETVQLDNVVLGEPDSGIFQPPADYKVRDPEQEELQREQTQPSITHPELLAGLWETFGAGLGGIDGFDVVLFTRVRGSRGRSRFRAPANFIRLEERSVNRPHICFRQYCREFSQHNWRTNNSAGHSGKCLTVAPQLRGDCSRTRSAKIYFE
jgi:hypothetical protein